MPKSPAASRTAAATTSTPSLHPLVKWFWIICGLFFGVIPTFVFFVWVSLDNKTNLMLQPNKLAHHLLSSPSSSSSSTSCPSLTSPPPQLLFDVGTNTVLFLIWGFFHSFFASTSFHSKCVQILGIPPAAMRMVFYLLNAVTTVLLMGLWKDTECTLYCVVDVPLTRRPLFSFVLFWVVMGLNLIHVLSLDFMQFIGVGQLLEDNPSSNRTVSTPKLITSGFYRYARHPIYAFTMMAFIITPCMTVNRAIITVASIMYLIVGVPVEERKLVAIFGNDYEEYKSRVPAVFPLPFFGGSGAVAGQRPKEKSK